MGKNNYYIIGEKFPNWIKKYNKIMKYIHRNNGFSDILIIVVKDSNNNRSLRYLQEGDTVEELSKNILKVCNCGKFFPNCYCSIYRI